MGLPVSCTPPLSGSWPLAAVCLYVVYVPCIQTQSDKANSVCKQAVLICTVNYELSPCLFYRLNSLYSPVSQLSISLLWVLRALYGIRLPRNVSDYVQHKRILTSAPPYMHLVGLHILLLLHAIIPPCFTAQLLPCFYTFIPTCFTKTCIAFGMLL